MDFHQQDLKNRLVHVAMNDSAEEVIVLIVVVVIVVSQDVKIALIMIDLEEVLLVHQVNLIANLKADVIEIQHMVITHSEKNLHIVDHLEVVHQETHQSVGMM
jgi:hypothetical protein